MLSIPGIDQEHVELYGPRFLGLIATAKDSFLSMQRAGDRPYDPNHQHVTVISSDDEDMDGKHDVDIDIDFDEGNESYEDGVEEISTYFQPPQEVQIYNRRCKS